MTRAPASRLRRVKTTIEDELGADALNYVNGPNGMGRWPQAYKDHVIESMHLGRIKDGVSRKLMRAIILLSFATYHNDAFAATQSNIDHLRKSRDRHAHLRMNLNALWRTIQNQIRSNVDEARVVRRFQRQLLTFAQGTSITCSSIFTTGFAQPDVEGAAPLFSRVLFRGEIRGQPPRNLASQTMVHLDPPGRKYGQ